jgi:hypothetical protein
LALDVMKRTDFTPKQSTQQDQIFRFASKSGRYVH